MQESFATLTPVNKFDERRGVRRNKEPVGGKKVEGRQTRGKSISGGRKKQGPLGLTGGRFR